MWLHRCNKKIYKCIEKKIKLKYQTLMLMLTLMLMQSLMLMQTLMIVPY